jgi:hypothetical protein
MAEVVLTISKAEDWNSVMQQAKQELAAGNTVTVKQTAPLVFGGGVIPMVELSTDPDNPAQNFRYDGQGNTIWFKGANLLDLWVPGSSTDWTRWSLTSMPTGAQVDNYDPDYGFSLIYKTGTPDRYLLWKGTKGTLPLAFSYAVSFRAKGNNGTSYDCFTCSLLDSNGTVQASVTPNVYLNENFQVVQATFPYLQSALSNFQYKVAVLDNAIVPEIREPWFGISDVMPPSNNYGFGVSGLSMFGYLKNSTIKHVYIKWANFAYPYNVVNTDEIYGGVLARGMENCTVLNVQFEGCQPPMTYYTGLIAGRAYNVNVRLVKAIDSAILRPETNVIVSAATGTPTSGGLFGLAIAPMEIYDVDLTVDFYTYLRTAQRSYNGGLIGVLVRTQSPVTIKRVATYPGFYETSGDSQNDALIGVVI